MIIGKNSDGYNKVIISNVIAAFVIKGGGLCTSFILTPAFIRYFDNNVVLGVWYTILSVLTWVLNFDLGIGNGIRNKLVVAFVENDKEMTRRIMSSGFFAVLIVSVVLLVPGLYAICNFNLNEFFNIPTSIITSNVLVKSCLYIYFAIILRLSLTIINTIFYALQKSSINNFLGLISNIIQLIFVILVHFDNVNESLLYLSLFYLISSNLPVAVAGVILFLTKLRCCVPAISKIDKTTMKSIMQVGGIFFFCQIAYMMIMNTNEFFITKFFSPEYTADYTFYYRISGLVGMVASLSLTPVWSVVTKAMVENNWKWIGKFLSKIKLISGVVLLLELGLVPFVQMIMDVWLGSSGIQVEITKALAFAIFGWIFVYCAMLSTVACGLAKMKLQAICYSLGVLFKVVSVVYMSKVTNDWSVVVWSNALLLVFYCICEQWSLDRLISEKLAIS